MQHNIPKSVANHKVINLIIIVAVIAILKGIFCINNIAVVPASVAPNPPGINEIAPSNPAAV